MRKTLVVFSGGLDSSVVLYSQRALGTVETISFDYGQRHARELKAARDIAATAGVAHSVVNLSDVFEGNSCLLDRSVSVPEGHYESETMKVTVVPNRNMVFLSIAASVAMARGFDAIACGVHGGDHAVYADCRPEFIDAMARSIAVSTGGRLLAPLLRLRKPEVVSLGASLGVPLHLTYSCYVGHPSHCGKCGTCFERREAFKISGVKDLTVYYG